MHSVITLQITVHYNDTAGILWAPVKSTSTEVAAKPLQISVEKTVKLTKINEVHYEWKVGPIKVKQSIGDFTPQVT